MVIAFCFLCFMLKWYVLSSRNISLINLDKFSNNVIVWANKTKNHLFTYSKKELNKCDCSEPQQYILNYNDNHIVVRIELEDYDELNEISILNSMPNLSSITYFNKKHSNSTSLYNTSLDLIVDLQCIDIKDNSNKIAVITFFLNITNQIQNKISETNYSFDILQNCEKVDVDFLINKLITMAEILFVSCFTIYYSTKQQLLIQENNTDESINNKITIKYFIQVVIVGSICLLFIYYFGELFYIQLFFNLLFMLLLYESMTHTLDSIGGKKNHLHDFQFLNKIILYQYTLFHIIIRIIVMMIMLCYFINQHWLLNNIFAFNFCYLALQFSYLSNFKQCSFGLFCVCLYDIFWVYLSPYFFNGNVMQIAATRIQKPIKMQIPIFFKYNLFKPCIILGLGDIIIPGYVMKFCKRFDFIKQISYYYNMSFVFYGLSLVLAGIAFEVFNYPQPVICFIFPTLIFGIGIVAYLKNDLIKILNADIAEKEIIAQIISQKPKINNIIDKLNKLHELKSKDSVINIPQKKNQTHNQNMSKKTKRKIKKMKHQLVRR